MAKITRFMSWNVRGLNNSIKRIAVLRTIKRIDAEVICLQETHLPPTPIPQFAPRLFSHQYHATGSVYSRGVSFLIRRGTQFSCIEVKTDPEGRFVFLLCSLYGMTCILAGLYIPPPYSTALLRILVGFMSRFPSVPVLVLGDFNNYLDPGKDKLRSLIMGPSTPNPGATPFARLLAEMGLTDVWRMHNPEARVYSCQSASVGGLSRIDLGLGTDLLLPLVVASQYHPRQTSDHSPFSVDLRLGAIKGRSLWKLNPFWLSLIPETDPIPDLLQDFFRQNLGTAEISMVWDTAKAYLRGQFIRIISQIKTKTKEWEERVLTDAQRSEAAYVADPNDNTKRNWLASQSLLGQVSLQLAENKRFFLQQKHFEEGENTGHVLAMIAKSQQSSSHIVAIQDAQGTPCYSSRSILDSFSHFFQEVYSSKVHPTQGELSAFLDRYPHPGLPTGRCRSTQCPIDGG